MTRVTHSLSRFNKSKLVFYRASLVMAFWFTSLSVLLAQMGLNAPSGLKPRQDMEIYSRDKFLIQQKYIATTDPISLTFTLDCGNNPPTLIGTTGMLLDPGGTSSYIASSTCSQRITTTSSSFSVGYEVTFDFLDTEANGDSVIITDASGGRVAFSGNTTPPVLLIQSNSFSVTFKADNDSNVGAGFQLRWRILYTDQSPTAPSDRFGNTLFFDLTTGALRTGSIRLGLPKPGRGSTALGTNNSASGGFGVALGVSNTASGADAPVAIGRQNIASNDYAIAMGFGNIASNSSALAVGSENTASGFAAIAVGSENTASNSGAVAMGLSNTASGVGAISIGQSNTASGRSSVALGNQVSTSGLTGAFIFGDDSGTTPTFSTSANQYTARFAGGYRLFTNASTTIGASLAAGGNAWATISDSTKKERFLAIDGPALLRNIGAMKLGTWNYIGQRDQRHYGPMAQEFFARFGHDAFGVVGCDTLLNSHDFTAVTFTGVQALVKENEALKAEIAKLRAESRLEAIELLLPARRRTVNAARK